MSFLDQNALHWELGPVADGNVGRAREIDRLFDRCMADLSDPALRAGAASVLAECLTLYPYVSDLEDPLSPEPAFLLPIYEPITLQNTTYPARPIA